jgi:hypothetical protein
MHRGMPPFYNYPLRRRITQHLDDLEDEADAKGGVTQVLLDHFAKTYKVAAPRELFAAA